MSLILKTLIKRALAVALAAALLVGAHGPRPAQAQAGGPVYIVQEGDTLFGIALRFGISVEALQSANGGVDPAALGLGSELVIPGYEGLSGTLGTHTVAAGESLPSLALRFGLRRETLVRLNRIVNPEVIYIGQSVVTLDPADAGPALPAGVTYAARPAEGLLALAAGRNQSPWALAAHNQLATPTRLAPGGLVVVPGGEAPPTSLPYPVRGLSVSPVPVTQGTTLALRLTAAEPVSAAGVLGEWALNFNTDQPAGSDYYALQGIPRLADPDLYRLALTVTSADGTAVSFSQPVPVRPGDYPVDEPLTVNPETLDPANTQPENEQVRAVVSQVTPTRYWDGLFVLPSVGALRSVFGSLRSYNGGPYDSFHGGVDFSGGEDRPITAPAPGVVVFTGPLTVRGNATIIDHGWGVFTGYWHQSAIEVAVGDFVETGQVLGYNGATGRVTGPHLHWEMFVGGVQVNPLQWTEMVFP